MAIEKHLKLTGISNVSWKDTIDYISSVTVLEQKAKIDGNKIIEYYSTIDLTFSVDENRI